MERREILGQTFHLTDEQVEQLSAYVTLLEKAPMNLTAWRGDILWERGVFESLALGQFLNPEDKRALDIGSGGGFPGMVLAVAHPAVQWVLLESRERRCDFLAEVAERSGLRNVRVVRARAEHWVRDQAEEREAFDVVVMRAVAPSAQSLELGLPYVRVGGRLLLVKGSGGPEELQGAMTVMTALGGALDSWVGGVVLGGEAGHVSQVGIIDKVGTTPEVFPRAGKALGRLGQWM